MVNGIPVLFARAVEKVAGWLIVQGTALVNYVATICVLIIYASCVSRPSRRRSLVSSKPQSFIPAALCGATWGAEDIAMNWASQHTDR